MDYILCSVLWRQTEQPPGTEMRFAAAARLDENGNVLEKTEFVSDENRSAAEKFIGWCGEDYSLCVWDGASAGRIRKVFSSMGRKHPYIHLYHLAGLYDISAKKCHDPGKAADMRSLLKSKPIFRNRPNYALKELDWMCGIFACLDFSAAGKKENVPFTELPSNKYFVFRNGKCFHTAACKLVRNADASSLKAYTYYSTVTACGFTPCSRCKPADTDRQTSEQMRRINLNSGAADAEQDKNNLHE